jgi:hypothetical protein
MMIPCITKLQCDKRSLTELKKAILHSSITKTTDRLLEEVHLHPRMFTVFRSTTDKITQQNFQNLKDICSWQSINDHINEKYCCTNTSSNTVQYQLYDASIFLPVV